MLLFFFLLPDWDFSSPDRVPGAEALFYISVTFYKLLSILFGMPLCERLFCWCFFFYYISFVFLTTLIYWLTYIYQNGPQIDLVRMRQPASSFLREFLFPVFILAVPILLMNM